MTSSTPHSAIVALAESSVVLQLVHEDLVRLTTALEGLVSCLPLVATDVASFNEGATVPTFSGHFAATSATATAIPSATEASFAEPKPVMTPQEVATRLAKSSNTVTFYLVSRGREPGVYDNPTDATFQTGGVSNAQVVKVSDKQSAIAQYTDLYYRGAIKRAP